jgi:hypothetical protein
MQQINVSTSLPLFFERPELEDDNINNNYGINNNMMHRDVYSPPLTSEQLAVFYHRQTSQAQPSMFGLDNAAAVGSINRKLEQLINAVKRNSKLALCRYLILNLKRRKSMILQTSLDD